MLHKLIIQNYALIDTVEIDFSDRLNVITGETGAGKSIILGALSLILGQRQEQTSFFNSEKKCVVEGHFKIQNYGLHSFFQEQELDYEDITIIRREISPDGRSRAFVNDSPVNLSVLKSLTESLVAIHSQHAVIELGKQSFQLSVLDGLAQQHNIVKEFGKKHHRYLQKIRSLEKYITNAKQHQSELDYLQFQFDELETAQLKSGELEQLETELKTLSHAEDILKNLQGAHYLISEAEPSQDSLLKDLIQQLQSVEKYHPTISHCTQRLKSVHIELRDITSELEVLQNDIFVDESRLQFVQNRLDTLYTLIQKHKLNNSDELIALQQQLQERISGIEHSDEHITQLQQEIEKEEYLLHQEAHTIRAKRLACIPNLESEVKRTLSQLGMANAVLNVTLIPNETLNPNGIDIVDFLFSANAGQTTAKVAKVASGGELSRLMLAIKALLAKEIALPTIIFDEIDTGISGEVALQMGSILEQLSQSMQVAAITHLPQIAAKGQHHLYVYKENYDNRYTQTQLKKLANEERIVAIAEMLSGKNPNEAAIENAKTLLNNH